MKTDFPKQERSFGVVFGVVFAIVALYPMLSGGSPRFWLLPFAVVLPALGYFAPRILTLPSTLWLKFGKLLELVISPIVLGVIFLIAFVPVNLLLRASKKDLLGLKVEQTAKTYWKDRADPMQPMQKQF